MIYFLRSGPDNFIKIGYSSEPTARAVTLATGSPYEGEILATIAGSREEERGLHVRFAASRIRGEWFRPSGDLIGFIADIRDSAPPSLPRDLCDVASFHGCTQTCKATLSALVGEVQRLREEITQAKRLLSEKDLTFHRWLRRLAKESSDTFAFAVDALEGKTPPDLDVKAWSGDRQGLAEKLRKGF